VYTKKLNFSQSTQSGDQSVIRNADFRESTRELSPKLRAFFQKYLFRVGGACVLHARADFEKGSAREWLITDQAPSVVEHAAHEKPEACEISSPHQL
jgi:hypothetical protein